MSDLQKPYKKLFRSTKNRILAGVCAGLANYFNIDPTIVRLAFVGFALAGGSALIIYLLMWIIVPARS